MRDDAGAAIGFVKILRDQTGSRTRRRSSAPGPVAEASQESEARRREAELQKEHLAALFTEAPAPICILRGADYQSNSPTTHVQLWATARTRCSAAAVRCVPSMRVQVLKDLLDRVMTTGVTSVARGPAGSIATATAPRRCYMNFTYAPLHGHRRSIDGVLVMAYDAPTKSMRASR